jgi:hypothetical protein
MLNPRVGTLVAIIIGAMLSRLIPHPPNATSITAVALFSGAYFADKRLAFALPITALFLSDAMLGFYSHMEVVYLSFALIVCLGFTLNQRRSVLRIGIAAVLASIVFFLVTNFGVWAFGGLYPHTVRGLAECYILALPFFTHTLIGDLFYTALLFGGFALLQNRFPVLRPALPQPAWRG